MWFMPFFTMYYARFTWFLLLVVATIGGKRLQQQLLLVDLSWFFKW